MSARSPVEAPVAEPARDRVSTNEPVHPAPFGISWLNRDLMWLFVLRVLRSISQGYLGIILPLYLVALGYGAEALGILLAFSAVAAAGISTLPYLMAGRLAQGQRRRSRARRPICRSTMIRTARMAHMYKRRRSSFSTRRSHSAARHASHRSLRPPRCSRWRG